MFFDGLGNGYGEFYINGHKFDGRVLELEFCPNDESTVTITGFHVGKTDPKDYKLISRSEVWEKVKTGHVVKVVMLDRVDHWNPDVLDAHGMRVEELRKCIENDNVVFYEKVEVKEK